MAATPDMTDSGRLFAPETRQSGTRDKIGFDEGTDLFPAKNNNPDLMTLDGALTVPAKLDNQQGRIVKFTFLVVSGSTKHHTFWVSRKRW
jgi:hypothetical protein